MGRIYRGQSALRISARTFVDLEGILSCEIRFTKPDGSTGGFPAGVRDSLAGIIGHELVGGELDQGGWWTFWASVTFADGRSASGEADRLFVWEEGTAP